MSAAWQTCYILFRLACEVFVWFAFCFRFSGGKMSHHAWKRKQYRKSQLTFTYCGEQDCKCLTSKEHAGEISWNYDEVSQRILVASDSNNTNLNELDGNILVLNAWLFPSLSPAHAWWLQNKRLTLHRHIQTRTAEKSRLHQSGFLEVLVCWLVGASDYTCYHGCWREGDFNKTRWLCWDDSREHIEWSASTQETYRVSHYE